MGEISPLFLMNLDNFVEETLKKPIDFNNIQLGMVPKLNVVGCASIGERKANISAAPNFERVNPQEEREGVFCVIGYGPSLRKTLDHIRRDILSGHAVCTTSGAHDYLISNGIIPDFHTDMDPRARKAEFLNTPHKDIHYLMASVCHPDTWVKLDGYKTSIWHLSDAPEIEDFIAWSEPGSYVHPSAQCIGLNAIILGHTLGYRKFHIYGVDCSYADGQSHAGQHNGTCGDDRRVGVYCGGMEFSTRVEWIQYARNFIDEMIPKMPGCEFKVFGEGLMQQMLRQGLKEAA